jgi:hypothetical protein
LIEKMKNMGIFANMPETSQLTLFWWQTFTKSLNKFKKHIAFLKNIWYHYINNKGGNVKNGK